MCAKKSQLALSDDSSFNAGFDLQSLPISEKDSKSLSKVSGSLGKFPTGVTQPHDICFRFQMMKDVDKDTVDRIFRSCDKTGDGKMSLDDLRRVLQKLKTPPDDTANAGAAAAASKK